MQVTAGAASATRVGASPTFGIAAGLVATAVFLASCTIARGGFFSTADPGDVGRYHEFERRILDGELPYRDFYMEYPPGAIGPFLAPAVVAGDDDYNGAFKATVAVAGIGVIAVLVGLLLALGAGRLRTVVALGLFATTPVTLGAVTLNRYDLWPALLVVTALLAFVVTRHRVGFALLAVGCAVKIFPVVAVPVAALHVLRASSRREAARGLAVFLAVCLALFLPLALVAPGGFGFSVETQLVRQLQLESVASSLLLAADQVGLYAARIVPGSPGSIDLAGAVPDALGIATTLAFLVAFAAVVVAYRRAHESDELLVAGVAASVAAFVAFSKVVSPQFLVWLVPLVPLVAGPAGFVGAGLLLAILVATQVEVVYEHALRDGEWPVWVLLGRNVLLVALWLVLLAELHRRRASSL